MRNTCHLMGKNEWEVPLKKSFHHVSLLVAMLMLASCSPKTVQQAPPSGGVASISEKDLYHHMSFLASDEMQGRDTGDQSLEIAARYIATELEKLYLTPVGDDSTYFQRYTLEKQAVSPSSSMSVSVDGIETTFEFGKQFVSLPMGGGGGSQAIEGEVVFAGYGIYAPDFGYDSYQGIGAKDKIVVIMGSEPKNEEGNSIFDSTKATSQFAQFPAKMQAAMASGAKAFIFVSAPGDDDERANAQFEQIANFMKKPRFKLPGGPAQGMGGNALAMFAKPELADALLAGTGKTLADIHAELKSQKKPQPLLLENVNAKINVEVEDTEIEVPNVLALLEGSDPVLKNEVVVYTAHFDHVGTNEKGEIFNGADDDGSGTTALLEIAEAYALNNERPKRSVLFLWVSGEEKGLLGSRYYSENPKIAMEQTVANINMDMVGRVRAVDDTSKANEMLCLAKDLFVVGGHQSSELKKLNELAAQEVGINIDYSLNDLNHPQRIYYRSDHYNFARKGVPVLFYTTGLHVDYHKATDTPDKISYTKIKDVASMGYVAGWKVANQEKRIVVDNPLELN